VNRRDRVLAALNHQESDRVPVDFGGHRSSGIAAIAYAKLRDYLGLVRRPIRVYDLGQQLAIVDDDVLDRFGIDTIELGRAFDLNDADWVDWVLPDGRPCQVPAVSVPERVSGGWVLHDESGRVTSRMPDGALYFEQVYYPFAENPPDHEGLAKALPAPVPAPATPVRDQTRTAAAQSLHRGTDRAVLGLFGGQLFEGGQSYYRNDNFMMLLASEPALAHDFLERLTALHIAALEDYLRLYGSSMDVIVFGDDLGMQTGPLMSPRMYREFFKPRHALMWRRAKELACTGMEAAGLKRDFGKDLTFWGGGCETRWMLAHGTPAQIQDHVREQVATLRPGGGFVFQQVHNALADVPPENIVAMLDAVNA
jgi:uroporphyrinogen decarboxylase